MQPKGVVTLMLRSTVLGTITHSLVWITSLNVFFYYNLIKIILSLNYDGIKQVDKETISAENKRIFII